MNITHPLKYHCYTFRKPYLLYFLLFFIFLLAALFAFNHLNNFYKYLSATILLITFIFTVLITVYEFTLLVTHYLNLKTIKIEFIISSIIFSIIHAIIQTLLLFVSYLIIKAYNPEINQLFAFNNFGVYSFTFVLHLFIYAVIGFTSLILKNYRFIQIVIYLIVLLIVALISFEITKSIIDFIYNLYANTNLLLKLNPLIIIVSALIWSLIYLKINIIKK